jgi:hypothetical protein
MHPAIKIDISQPCHQPWNDMKPLTDGHYCQSCQKTVIDFSAMSDKEIFQYINRADHSICGRLSNAQLNKVIQPAAKEKPASYWKNIWQLIIAGTLFINQAKSQVKYVESITANPANNDSLIKSLDENAYLVVDENKQPLPFATVSIDSVNNTTDNNGIFRINKFSKKITVSYVGYKTAEFSPASLPECIQLEQNMDLLREVSVTGYQTTTCSFTAGGIGMVRVLTPFNKLVRSINQFIPDPAVKIFPNPVIKGQSLNIQLSLPESGKYSLKLFASDGRLIHIQSLQINSDKQQLQLPISSTYSSGIYWLQISNPSEKQKSHEIKVMIR